MQLFTRYVLLVDQADAAFREMATEHHGRVQCERRCSDCCHAVFGLFLIEAAYIKQQFDQLSKERRLAALRRCNQTEKDLRTLQQELESHANEPHIQAQLLATSRARCPLLDDNEECSLYPYRPITCRVYGIPTRINGNAHVCRKANFETGQLYPIFDLDKTYHELFTLSKQLLNDVMKGDPEKAALLISIPKTIGTPVDELVDEIFR